jgi:glutamate N-acetyltransferase / amino-acid N-acetyltransferase
VAVGLHNLPELLPVAGLRLGTARAGIKYPDRRDLVLIELGTGTSCAAVFTRNAFCAAPVQVAREHLHGGAPRYLLINTGNANAGTGEPGLRDARACCAAVAGIADCGPHEVLPFSTGVIGEPLPIAAIEAGLPAAWEALDAGGWADAAHGIMTTDTVPKGISRQVEIDGQSVTVTGIAKGAGMIRPDMATMLAFIGTDAGVAPDLLQRCLQRAVQRSFNRVTVDGDTSTNDACVLMATGRAPLAPIDSEGQAFETLCEAVAGVCEHLAQALIRDGEGATKFVTVEVAGGRDADECLAVAYTVAHSPLVKTALFASDPNWGRILAAVGRAGVRGLALERVTIHLDDVCIVRDGGRAAEYTEALGQAVMAREEIAVLIDLGRGAARERVWTCDFSYDYVRINAEYRT